MARKRTSGGSERSDSAYNARRRFLRKANSYLDKAKDTIGAESTRYRELARNMATKAAQLYERKGNIPHSSKFNRVAKELGIQVEELMRGKDETKREQEQVERLKKESETVVQPSKLSQDGLANWRREQEANAILSSPIGSRIYAGLVDVWAKPTYRDGEWVNERTTEDINKAIMDYYEVDNMMDVIEILEKQVDLYADPESLERYDAVSLQIAMGLYR